MNSKKVGVWTALVLSLLIIASVIAADDLNLVEANLKPCTGSQDPCIERTYIVAKPLFNIDPSFSFTGNADDAARLSTLTITSGTGSADTLTLTQQAANSLAGQSQQLIDDVNALSRNVPVRLTEERFAAVETFSKSYTHGSGASALAVAREERIIRLPGTSAAITDDVFVVQGKRTNKEKAVDTAKNVLDADFSTAGDWKTRTSVEGFAEGVTLIQNSDGSIGSPLTQESAQVVAMNARLEEPGVQGGCGCAVKTP